MTRRERHRVFVRTLAHYPRFARRGERIFKALWTADHLGPKELRAFLAEIQSPSEAGGRAKRCTR
jgi:hypothetical protein